MTATSGAMLTRPSCMSATSTWSKTPQEVERLSGA
jgi:hypothetical protein